MKLLVASLAMLGMALVTPKLHADPVLTVNTGAAGGILTETHVGDVFTWTYTDTNAMFSALPPGFDIANQTFTAAFTDLPGAQVLTLTDVCANVAVGMPPSPCAGLAFTFTDAGIGTGVLTSDVSLLGALNGYIAADVVGIDVAASIGGGTATISFPGSPAPTPEPGTLSLLGTGVLGMAGIVRKRYLA